MQFKQEGTFVIISKQGHLLFCKHTEPIELAGTFVAVAHCQPPLALMSVLLINDAPSLGFKHCTVEKGILKPVTVTP